MEFRKDNMSEYCKNCYELQQQLDQLKAENKDLKKQVNLTQMFLDACNNSCEHYTQTLIEIKEIAKWHTTSADSEDAQEDMKQILQKTSEVEEQC